MDNKTPEFLVPEFLYGPAFSPEECQQIKDYAKLLPNLPAKVDDGEISDYKRKCIVKGIDVNEFTFWFIERIMNFVKHADQLYYHYDVVGLEKGQFLEYNESDHFYWHMDSSSIYKPFFKRKLSIIVFLSNPVDYEGGKLEITPAEKNNIPGEQGYMIIFPSYKTHRVTPVTKGNRCTLVTWALIE